MNEYDILEDDFDEDFGLSPKDSLLPVPRSPDEIMTAPPDEESQLPFFSTKSLEELPEKLTLENSEDILEHAIVETLLSVMRSSKAKEADRLKAAAEGAELLGKKGKGSVNIIKTENAQINQIMEQPDLMKHLKKAAQGIKQVVEASDADVIVHEGGKGA